MVSTKSTRILKPNEGYGHLDIVTVNMPKGGQMQTSFFGLVDGLTRLYDRRSDERRVQRRLNNFPMRLLQRPMLLNKGGTTGSTYRVSSRRLRACFQRYSGYVLRAEGRQGKVTFYFENTPDPMDVKAMAEAEGVKIENLQET